MDFVTVVVEPPVQEEPLPPVLTVSTAVPEDTSAAPLMVGESKVI